MKISTALTLVTLLVPNATFAADLVFTGWGGTTQDVETKEWSEKFAANEGIKVLQDGPTDYGKLKAMVDAGNVSWDVVDVEADYGVQAGTKGLLEKLDFGVIDKSKLDPRFVTDYAVGGFYYSTVIGCNKDAVSVCPRTWAELFDTAKFPGKRSFYKWPTPGVLEAALLADGVESDKLYPLDLDRAFKKLDTIKSDIVWWGTGAQSQQLLASAETPYGAFWNGRLNAVVDSGVPVEISWDRNIIAADLLVVPKGTKNKDLAMKYIAFATSAESQAAMAKGTGYAPTNLDSSKLLYPSVAKQLPDHQTVTQINADLTYWSTHRDEIGERWYAWQSK